MPENLKSCESVIKTILKKYEGLSDDANVKVQMEIDRFVYDNEYQKQVVTKTFKNKFDLGKADTNKDGVL